MIKLDKKNTRHTFNCSEKPTIKVDQIHFNTNDKNWSDRLFTARLNFIIAGIDSEGQELKSHAVHTVLGEFITTQHKQPVIHIDREISFKDQHGRMVPDANCKRWIACIELYDIELLDNEHLNIGLDVG